jgi:hygromycin-B 7''-O-kinase
MRPLLPPISADAEYWELFEQDEVWLPAVLHLCDCHGLPREAVRAREGGNPVFILGGRSALKLFAPIWRREYESELAALKAVEGRAGVATPRVEAAGELDGWYYVVMSVLPGAPLSEVWSSIEAPDQARLVSDLGEVLATMHALPAPGPAAFGAGWEEFFAELADGCVARQRRYGASEDLLGQIPAYIEPRAPLLRSAEGSVLLHADLTHDHVFLGRVGGRWEITGIIDFGDARVGRHEYEFGAPAVFFLRGRPELVRPFLLSYGYREADLSDELSARLTAATVLHEFAQLPRILNVFGAGAPATLEQLDEKLWPMR